MIEFYPQIRHVHILAVILSGSLFALRGAFALAGARWPHFAPVRYLSYTIDTTLLTAALMLVTILPGAVFANGWLATKLVLVVAYVVLGVLAMKRGRTRGVRVGCYVAALATFAMIYTIARAHQPLGFLHAWFA
jgi:uncharacterized membrane protein SirB2